MNVNANEPTEQKSVYRTGMILLLPQPKPVVISFIKIKLTVNYHVENKPIYYKSFSGDFR